MKLVSFGIVCGKYKPSPNSHNLGPAGDFLCGDDCDGNGGNDDDCNDNQIEFQKKLVALHPSGDRLVEVRKTLAYYHLIHPVITKIGPSC